MAHNSFIERSATMRVVVGELDGGETMASVLKSGYNVCLALTFVLVYCAFEVYAILTQ